jgi:hypothetical protein
MYKRPIASCIRKAAIFCNLSGFRLRACYHTSEGCNPHFDSSANLATVGQRTDAIDNQLRACRGG